MFLILLISLVIGESLAESHPWIAQPRNKTTEEYWWKKHERLINQTHEHGKDAQIIFIGDSITENWGGQGKAVWAKYYAPRHAYNYGIGGDRTEHVLYRIENKELDGLKPKVAVLMIGTNNLPFGGHPDEIARGVQEILKQLEVRLPSTKIILLGVLPRNEPAGTRAKKLNVLLKKMANNKTVFWLDMWSSFESAQGKQHTELYVPGNLHLNAAGYEVWHKTMEPLLSKLDPAH